MTELGRGSGGFVVGDGLPACWTVRRAVVEELDDDRHRVIVRAAVHDERSEQVLLVEIDS